MTVSRMIDSIPTKSAEERRQMRENARRQLERGGEAATDAKAMLEALDSFEPKVGEPHTRAATGSDRVSAIVEAFQILPMSKSDQLLVQVLLDNPDATSEQLSEEMGWKGQGWHLHFGAMYRRREHLLWPAPIEPAYGKPFYGGILAEFDGPTRGYTLSAEAVEVLARLGLRPQGST